MLTLGDMSCSPNRSKLIFRLLDFGTLFGGHQGSGSFHQSSQIGCCEGTREERDGVWSLPCRSPAEPCDYHSKGRC